jgi:hypothetical protein
VSGNSTECELLLVSEMYGEQLPLHMLVVVGSNGVGGKR